MDLLGTGPVVWIQELLGPGWVTPFEILTILGSTWGVLLVAGMVFWVWGRGPLYGILVLVAVEAVLKASIAALAAVERPPAGEIVKYERVEGYSSFPSGHVSSATAMWCYPAFLGKLPLAVGLGVGVVVAVTRLYLGVHWVVDVVAGLLIGLLAAWLVSLAHDRVVGWARRIPPAAWAVAGAVLVAGSVAAAIWWLGATPPKWTAVGFLAGLGIALPAERRWVRYEPAGSGFVRGVVTVLIGWAGIAACLWWARSGGDEALVRRAVMAFAATIWALLVAPALFRIGRRPGPSS